MKRTVPCDFFEQCGEQAAYFSRPLKKHICIGHALSLAALLVTKRLSTKPKPEPPMKPKKSTLLKIKDGGRVLYYRLHKTRPDGVCGDLVGYRKQGKDHWY